MNISNPESSMQYHRNHCYDTKCKIYYYTAVSVIAMLLPYLFFATASFSSTVLSIMFGKYTNAAVASLEYLFVCISIPIAVAVQTALKSCKLLRAPYIASRAKGTECEQSHY